MWTLKTCPDKNDSLPKTFFVTDVLMTDTFELSHPFTFAFFFLQLVLKLSWKTYFQNVHKQIIIIIIIIIIIVISYI